MTAGKLDLVIEQGASFRRLLTWKDAEDNPIDLTGYSARMQAREHLSSPSAFLELTTENDRISIDGEAGQLTLTLDAETTDAITPNDGVYDLEVESAEGEITRLLQGNIIIERSVTR